MPAPKSRLLQVSGQVGTLQPAIRHNLDIQREDNALVYSALSLVSPWQHPFACCRCTGTTLADAVH